MKDQKTDSDLNQPNSAAICSSKSETTNSKRGVKSPRKNKYAQLREAKGDGRKKPPKIKKTEIPALDLHPTADDYTIGHGWGFAVSVVIISAPEVFQKRNQKLFGDIEGVEIYFDDIIVAEYDEDSHDAIMSKVLERAGSLNIKFNPDKLQYRVSEVKYVGQIISKSGVKPDPDHIKAIVAMPTPKSKTEVRRLLGMVNFLSRFIPNVSNVTAPLREIIHEIVEFNRGKEQELSFVNIKELLAKAPILKVFCASDEIIIQCDSSKDGLGSCLIQKGQPVSFVSRCLTNREKNYAQIEKELLAIVFSFEKHHNFVYGRKVAIQSDHKPLTAIVKKPMHKISSRMQRIILKLLKYDFEINYVPGNQMFIADTLSRAFPVNETVRDDPEMLNIVHTVSK
ncbi:retrovirus-related Pol polyprotein from transposon opus [Nephila pilipes]|uniref:Retrovirus-related Pol polyprotein from transposon opus n=1 Tax=Nephila pilipes TaxID=299642 RepID=A0A8X6QEB6_NEPPI|nr:retrovirus-related Pol polyprotein from transposon opus [Nephila pilipes]